MDSLFPGFLRVGPRSANDGRYKSKEEDEIDLQLHVRVRQVTRTVRVGGD